MKHNASLFTDEEPGLTILPDQGQDSGFPTLGRTHIIPGHIAWTRALVPRLRTAKAALSVSLCGYCNIYQLFPVSDQMWVSQNPGF